MGDGGSADDPLGQAQNPQSLLGKMLRLDVESNQKPYAIPANNPFKDNNRFRDEIWALGLRNPWRFSFDRERGDLYIADVGQNQFEEINVQLANSQGGENYGWNKLEALHCFKTILCDKSAFVLPILEYDHSQGDRSITGGHVYRGHHFSDLVGMYFYADFSSGRLWGLRQTETHDWKTQLLFDTSYNISTFGEGEQGYIYLADYRQGRVYRIEGYDNNQ